MQVEDDFSQTWFVAMRAKINVGITKILCAS